MEQLEKDLLEWIAGNNDCEALATQLAGARVTKRDYMRTGFFIFLEAPKDAAWSRKLAVLSWWETTLS
jgi:hypothetical protein